MNNSFFSVRGCRPFLLSLVICVTIYSVNSYGASTPSVPRAVPNAGSIENMLRQTQPDVRKPPQAAPVELSAIDNEQNPLNEGNSSARLTLTAVKVESGLFTPDSEETAELQTQIKRWLGRPLSFSDLQAMAAHITRFFRAKGYVAARAYLPPQTLQSGEVTVKVLPGMLDKPVVTNTSGFSSSFATAIIESNTCAAGTANCASSPAEMTRLERTALLLNEMPGVDAKLTLEPGTQSGTTRIHADLTPGKTVGGYLGADNQGNDYSGHNRALGGFYLNNLTGLGDQLRADMSLSSSADVFNGKLEYSLPVNSYGTRGGLNYSHLDYTLKGPFTALDAHGQSDIGGIYLTHPWIRTAQARVDVRGDVYTQQMRDSLWTLPKQKRNLNAVDFGTSGVVAALPQGLTNFTLQGTAGHLSLNDDYSRAVGNLTKIDGRFARFNYQLGHDQEFGAYFSFFNQFTGQMASKNLDSSQKLLLGGPNAVRAYGVGEAPVDQGTLYTTELRTRWALPLPDWAGEGHELTVAAFFDQGWGKYLRDPIPGVGDNNINISGFGVYTTLARSGDYTLNLTWAHRTGQAVTAHQDNDQLWLSAYKAF